MIGSTALYHPQRARSGGTGNQDTVTDRSGSGRPISKESTITNPNTQHHKVASGKIDKTRWRRRVPYSHILRHGTGVVQYLRRSWLEYLQKRLPTGQLPGCFHIFRVRDSSLEHTLKEFLGYTADVVQSFFRYQIPEKLADRSEGGRKRSALDKKYAQEVGKATEALERLSLPISLQTREAARPSTACDKSHTLKRIADITGNQKAHSIRDKANPFEKQPQPYSPGGLGSSSLPTPEHTAIKEVTRSSKAVQEGFTKRQCRQSVQLQSLVKQNPFQRARVRVGTASAPNIQPPSARTFMGPPTRTIDIDQVLQSRAEKHVEPGERDAAADDVEDYAAFAQKSHVQWHGQLTPPSTPKGELATSFKYARYTFHEMATFATAAALMCDSKWIEGPGARSRYPHTFRNDERLKVQGSPPFSIFPFLVSGIWDGSQRVGPDRVVLDKDYQYSGIIRHGRRSHEIPDGVFYLVK